VGFTAVALSLRSSAEYSERRAVAARTGRRLLGRQRLQGGVGPEVGQSYSRAAPTWASRAFSCRSDLDGVQDMRLTGKGQEAREDVVCTNVKMNVKDNA